MDDLREIEPCKGFGGGCRGMDCPVCDGARVIQQLRNDSDGALADYILDLRGRLEVAETQLQDAWRELACSDDISAVTVAGGINQLQRARETAETEARRYRFIRDRAAQDDQFAFNVVEEAAWATHKGCAHNFDFNIDAAMTTPAGPQAMEGESP